MNKPLILIVDDNPEHIQLLGKILSEKNYETAYILDGIDVFDFVVNKGPDLILLDINMPGMNGYEICHKIKNDVQIKDIPIIFFSADNSLSNIDEGYKAGAVDYIIKPFSHLEVIARIKTQIELRNAKRKLSGR